MKPDASERPSVETFEIRKEVEISAPIDIAFEAVLDQLGPEGQMPGDKPFPMKLEAWPGGRWYRDLGNNSGHLWGHVQVIKPPTLLEVCGPLMMSYPAANHLQYRLTAEGNLTRLAFVHRAMGLIPPDQRDGFAQGWQYWVERIRDLAERKSPKGKKR
ncbi:MAG: SRPBCC domain-containing protein [Zavarzinella sp.]|nr:SRPBCC domain-containing protein [Zavarzinella sp.]